MVEILGETQRFPALDRLEGALQALLEAEGLSEREVTVVLLGDEAMAERNEADLGVPGPTDVLSYPSSEPDDVGVPEVAHLGDVLIDLDAAARQAPGHGHGTVEEVLVLAAHGLTHLRGFDHPDEASWTPFLDAQRRILEWPGR
ncbi:MAG: rRNA maturation RNase YbeY [Trueperaceae bacterium]|nr:rRNA maturation RNase YbeY [Trueperaceae bacterium]